MYHSPHKLKSAHVAARSEKNDIKTLTPTRPLDSKRVNDGLWVTIKKGAQVLIPAAKLAEFYRRYTGCSTPADRVKLCNELAA